MTFFDSHSHLNFLQYDEDREEVVARMKEAGVGTITVGTDVKTSEESIELAEKYENIWASVGIHPVSAHEAAEGVSTTNGTGPTVDFSALENLVTEPKVVAVGECGLDFFHKPYDEKVQKELFLKHLALAQEHNLPLIIHCRSAYDELLGLLSKKDIELIGGVMHFFAGTEEQASAFLSLGMHISFAGPVTFTDEYDRVIAAVPLEKMLIETDAPFAAPAPYRGKRNEPAFVVEVAKKIAAMKGISVEEAAAQMTQNARELFKLN